MAYLRISEARAAARSALSPLQKSAGRVLTEEAQAFSYSTAERSLIARNRERLFVGDKEAVLSRLESLIADTGADEVMVTTMLYDHMARRHSYELLAQAFGLARA